MQYIQILYGKIVQKKAKIKNATDNTSAFFICFLKTKTNPRVHNSEKHTCRQGSLEGLQEWQGTDEELRKEQTYKIRDDLNCQTLCGISRSPISDINNQQKHISCLLIKYYLQMFFVFF